MPSPNWLRRCWLIPSSTIAAGLVEDTGRLASITTSGMPFT